MNRRACRTFLFDLDGTLIDSREDIAAALNRALLGTHLPPLPLEQVVAIVRAHTDFLQVMGAVHIEDPVVVSQDLAELPMLEPGEPLTSERVINAVGP